jgi:hypothetical protein
MTKLQLSLAEEEVIFLKAANDIIDGMVNYEMLALHGSTSVSSILFQTSTHQRLFNILLVDFLSLSDKRAPVQRSSFLGALSRITQDPQFDTSGSVAELKAATSACVNWLNHEAPVDVWFPSLDTEVELHLPRITYIKMCGNIAKHDLLRLIGVADDLIDALASAGVATDPEDALLALDDFYERFHTDVLNYHGSTIVQLLNDIRWGIHDYLTPEYHRSHTPLGGEPPAYRYQYPADVQNRFAQQRYWGLMNDIRRGPYLPRFETDPFLKLRY